MCYSVAQLQRDIADPQVSVVNLLHKAIPLASELGDKDFVRWANQELKGHKNESGSDYRQLRGQYVVLGTDGRSVPIVWDNNEEMNSRFITLPLSETESLLTGDCQTFAVKVQADPKSLTSMELEPGDTIGFSIGRATIIGFLNAIRQRVLEWTITKLDADTSPALGVGKHAASTSLSHEDAVQRLSAQIDSLAQVTDHDFPGWRHRTLGIIERIFGEDSRQARTFQETRVPRSLRQLQRAASDPSVNRRDILNTASLRSVLASFIDEIGDFGLPSPLTLHANHSDMDEEREARVVEHLKKAYLEHPSQRPARVCPTLTDIIVNCDLSKTQCYEIAARLELHGFVEWVAKQADGEFLRVQPSIVNECEKRCEQSPTDGEGLPEMIPGRWMGDATIRSMVERLLAHESTHDWDSREVARTIVYDHEASLADIEMVFRAAGRPKIDVAAVLNALANDSAVMFRQYVSTDGRRTIDVWTMDVAQKMDFERSYRGTGLIQAAEETQMTVDTRKVFVVHGRNDAARKATFEFLRSINLHPLEWSEIVHETGKGSPFVGEVLDTAFSIVQAVVVLMTPDDEARLRDPFHGSSEPSHETDLTPQPRPNVLFEAGMALGLFPERTVIVELGTLRPVSDLFGRHVVRMNNSIGRRQDLAQRLETSGCSVSLAGRDWHSAGDFEGAVI
ncbi:TIR domain-containing protein [Rosistilla oblonga]|uniref:Putative nucleotide-binding protein containing TIR-like domain protein n=1 Tax=Rosistilla oblonga TaxID=2527990 RepID=A0A518IT53_9BACT|nr:TIR domain-containing protein [Rosistilla oblonga]QDV56261.1 putative nucleotide-binding protein containing TIR-like domain protein [Rosistilla oblonga]